MRKALQRNEPDWNRKPKPKSESVQYQNCPAHHPVAVQNLKVRMRESEESEESEGSGGDSELEAVHQRLQVLDMPDPPLNVVA